MKLLLQLVLLTAALSTVAQSSKYLPIGSGQSMVYKKGDEVFAYHYPSISKQLFGKDYFLVIGLYEENRRDTTYYRETEEGILHLNTTTGSETVEIPADAIAGKVWYEPDSSWKYEIKSNNADLKTPAGEYTGLLEIEAKQLSNSDKSKAGQYNLFFAKGKGLAGSLVQGQLLNYLTEVQEGKYIFAEKTKKNKSNIPALIVLFTTIATFIGVGWFVKKKMFDPKSGS